MKLFLALILAAGLAYAQSCAHYCKIPGPKGTRDKFVCCNEKNTKVPGDAKPGRCPVIRDQCPGSTKFSPPQTCHTDYVCSGKNKCCFDRCLDNHVCKPPRKRRGHGSSHGGIGSHGGNGNFGGHQGGNGNFGGHLGGNGNFGGHQGGHGNFGGRQGENGNFGGHQGAGHGNFGGHQGENGNFGGHQGGHGNFGGHQGGLGFRGQGNRRNNRPTSFGR